MRLRTVSVTGFRSIVGPVVFRFDPSGGLCFMRGEMGSGKSSLWDAVHWALFGTTARGTKGAHVETWGGAVGTEVVVEFYRNQSDTFFQTVERTRRPNKLRANGHDAAQEEVEKLLGAGSDQFMAAVLFGQRARPFFETKPAERLALVSEALQLDRWERAGCLAAGSMSTAQERLATNQRRLERVQGSLGELERVTAEAETQARAWDAERSARLVELESNRVAFTQALEQWEGAVEQSLVTVKAAESLTRDRDREASRAILDAQKAREIVVRGREEIAGRYAVHEEAQRRLELLRSGRCSVCNGVVDAAVLRLEEATFLDVERKLKSDGQLLATVEVHAVSAEALVQSLDTARRTAYQDHVSARQKHTQNQSQQSQVRREWDGLGAQIQAHSEAQNPYRVSATENRKRFDEAAFSEKMMLEQVAEDSRDVDTLGEVIKFFREIRLWIIAHVLEELRAETASALHDLGLVGWSVDYQMERETKSGTLSRGFHIFIQAPGSPEGVPWEAWSGGETQRLCIAGTVALAGLVRARYPVLDGIEAWDEPTQGLNAQGVEDLVRFLKRRSLDRQIWLIDHRAVETGQFTRTVQVTKDQYGSRFE